MTLTIFKYPIPSKSYFQIELPLGAKILTVLNQREQPVLWALIDPGQPSFPRNFRLVATGSPIYESKNDLSYIGTFQLLNGEMIFHLFEIIKFQYIMPAKTGEDL